MIYKTVSEVKIQALPFACAFSGEIIERGV
jgi:hypothetical protein